MGLPEPSFSESFTAEEIEAARQRQHDYATQSPAKHQSNPMPAQPAFTEQQSQDMLDQSKSETPQHVVVISFQEENWGDDGGDHCPRVLHLTPAQMTWLQSAPAIVDWGDPMVQSIVNAPTASLPANVEMVETIWFYY
jgi:hypothetical protein